MIASDWFPLQVLHRGRTNLLTLVRDRKSSRHCVQKMNSVDMSFHHALLKYEISVHKNLHHRHIIKFIEECGDGSFIMAYAAFGSLRNYILHGACTLKNTLRYLRHILEAVTYLHQTGMVHNDIKPENILIDENNRALLCDFALTGESNKPFPLKMPEYFLHGSTGYMYKERIGKQMSLVQNDLYALGIMINELVNPLNNVSAEAVERLMEIASDCQNRRISQAAELLLKLKDLEAVQHEPFA